MYAPIGLELFGAEPAKDRIYDSPYFIPVYIVLLVLALAIWIEKELRMHKRQRKTGEKIRDE